jgi:hypothetical protein
MKRSNRVNLSLSDRMYKAVSGYAEVVGRTRTALIVEAMGHHLPAWEHAVRSQRYHVRQEGVSLEFGEVSRQASGDVSRLPGADTSAAMSNARAIWHAERERKAAAKAERRAKAAKRGGR